jgi:GMP reductase
MGSRNQSDSNMVSDYDHRRESPENFRILKGNMKIIHEPKLDFDNVLLVPKPNNLESRSGVNVTRRFTFKHSRQVWSGVPLISANMTTVTSFTMARVLSNHQIMSAIPKYYEESELFEFYNNGFPYDYCWYTVGSSLEDLEKLRRVNSHKRGIDLICIDVANGYRSSFLDAVARVRDQFPAATIMAGNVVTPDMIEPLVNAGADIVKIGIGGGGGCLTRLKTGVGYPQLTAIIECGEVAYDLGAHICSDGGCKTPGDIAKAYAAGADFVMLGSMLAGHLEVDAKRVLDADGKEFVEFYGMSSEKAMQEHGTGMADYRTSEGRHVMIPYRGSVENTILDILGGIRSAMTYLGARTIEEIPDLATFIKVSETHNKIYEQFGPKI